MIKYNKYLLVICTAVLSLSISCNTVFPNSKGKPTTAILGAFDEEVLILQNKLENKQQHTIEGIEFISGKLNDRRTVIAWTGIGKVNAAMTTTLAIEHFNPREVIFTGIAGGINPELLPGDIVIAEKTTQHDFGRFTTAGLENKGTINPINGKRNPVFFKADKQLVTLAERAANATQFEEIKENERTPKIIKGTVVTGDIFVVSAAKCDELRRKLGADAVEMEGAAVAQICYQQNTPCIVIRSISDKADEKAIEDVNKFYKIAAKNSASLVAKMVEFLHFDSTTKKEYSKSSRD